MSPGNIFGEFGPQARVSTAVAPFVIALVLRFVLGKNRMTRVLVSVSVAWFALNVLAAPYSVRMQQDIETVRQFFR